MLTAEVYVWISPPSSPLFSNTHKHTSHTHSDIHTHHRPFPHPTSPGCIHRQLTTHTQSPGPNCQSKAWPQTGALLIPAQECTKQWSLMDWPEACCADRESGVIVVYLPPPLDISASIRRLLSVHLSLQHRQDFLHLGSSSAKLSWRKLYMIAFRAICDGRGVCNWFHLRLIICTGRLHCCKPFIRMHIQHRQ